RRGERNAALGNACGSTNALEIRKNILERMRHQRADLYWFVREHRARLLHVSERYSAYAALILGHDEVGSQALEHLGPNVVDARTFANQVSYRSVDAFSGLDGIDTWLGAHGELSHVLGKVALMGDSDQAVT